MHKETRRSLKKAGHDMVRKHYFIFLIMTMVLIFFGKEFTLTTAGLGYLGEGADRNNNVLTVDSVYSSILEGNYSGGEEISDALEKQLKDDAKKNQVLGRGRGELAKLVNNVSSGKLVTMLAKSVRTMVGSSRVTSALLVLVPLIAFAFVWIFILNVIPAIARRVFLEARIYGKVPFLNTLHFLGIRRHTRASLTMLLRYIFQFLWSLTIIGGIIKYFSYFCVPYIVAENPDIRPKQAITLSRRMMDGHKMELFLFMLSYIGWYLLAAATLGISDIVYGIPYRLSGQAGYFAYVRDKARERQIPGSELLNDRYLYEQADKITLYEAYYDVVDRQVDIHEKKITLNGLQRFLQKWFGLWIGTTKKKREFDELEGLKFQIERNRQQRDGLCYPARLNPLAREKKLKAKGNFFFLRSYTLWTVFLLFIIFSVIGWGWEVGLHYMQTGEVVNRGTLLGPWLPIYGSGGVIALLLCSRFRKNPVLEFFMAILFCGAIEYFSGWYLEVRFHQRWWSYDGYFLNLHGRICAEGLLVFGVACCLVVYLIAPLFDFLISKIKHGVVVGICAALMILFGADVVRSSIHPNMVKGAVEGKASAKESADGGQKAEAAA